ncbi:MAG: transglutaminase-like domain-containing protein [Actinomycetota bacterium]|nr:transglutaminase-like domain-containing protein [Actinomycetota bacterium]
MPDLPAFAALAATPEAGLDVLALALAAEFRDVDAPEAIATLDVLGQELARDAALTIGGPEPLALACGRLLGGNHGFMGDRENYDDPDNSMLDLVLERRHGLPIVLSVVYVEVARRAGIPLAGVGLPGHFVVGHFGAHPPVLLDPFAGGGTVQPRGAEAHVRPWSAHEIVMRMLNNLVSAYQRRGDLGGALKAGRMRLTLPAYDSHRAILEAEVRAMEARLN